MPNDISRRGIMRRIAVALPITIGGLGTIGSSAARPSQSSGKGKGKPTIEIWTPRFATVVFRYLQENGPTVTLTIVNDETDEVVDEVTLEPGDHTITGYPTGTYRAEPSVGNGQGNGDSGNAVEVVGSPFSTYERQPPSYDREDEEDTR